LHQEEEHKESSTEYDFLWKLQENLTDVEEAKEEEKRLEQLLLPLFKLTPSDSLIDLSKHGAFLMKCFED
jgi:hypothetical protein